MNLKIHIVLQIKYLTYLVPTFKNFKTYILIGLIKFKFSLLIIENHAKNCQSVCLFHGNLYQPLQIKKFKLQFLFKFVQLNFLTKNTQL